MLTKNYQSRPEIPEIIQMPFFRSVAQNFKARRGKMDVHIPIKKTEYHKKISSGNGERSNNESNKVISNNVNGSSTKPQTSNGYNASTNRRSSNGYYVNSNVVSSNGNNNQYANMTPAERMNKRKEELAEQRKKELIEYQSKKDKEVNKTATKIDNSMRSELDKTTISYNTDNTNATLVLKTNNPKIPNGNSNNASMNGSFLPDLKIKDSKMMVSNFGYNDNTIQSINIGTNEYKHSRIGSMNGNINNYEVNGNYSRRPKSNMKRSIRTQNELLNNSVDRNLSYK